MYENNILCDTDCHIIVTCTLFVCGIARVIIGVTYVDDCTTDIILYLTVSGVIILAAHIWEVYFLVFKDGKSAHGKRVYGNSYIFIISTLAILCVTIWGSVIAFRAYNTITYDKSHKSYQNYCNYIPYMFVFVVQIIQWICHLPLLLFLTYIHFCLMLLYEVFKFIVRRR